MRRVVCSCSTGSASHTTQVSDFEYVGRAFKAMCADIVEVVEKGGEFPELADAR